MGTQNTEVLNRQFMEEVQMATKYEMGKMFNFMNALSSYAAELSWRLKLASLGHSHRTFVVTAIGESLAMQFW